MKLTLPRVGVGMQSGTLVLLIWLGGQANEFVEELSTGMDSLGERVTSLEAKVWEDPKARAEIAELRAELKAEREEKQVVETRLAKLEACSAAGKRVCK